MTTTPRSFALAGACLLIAAAAPAAMRGPRAARTQRAEAESFYQTGVNQYANGRYFQALSDFREALRRDPKDRAARVAIERVRQEIAMAATEKGPGSPPPAGRPSASGDDILSLTALERLFVWAIVEDRERSGRLQAMQGRIAQLLAEMKRARASSGSFRKDAELHALSRRLS